MSYNKNVVEDALFQIKNLEETLQENAKGILQSTMSEEIKQLVKESLKEQDDEEVDTPTPDADAPEDMDDEDMDMDDEDMDMGDEDMDMGDEDEMTMDDEQMSMDDETIDMTGASDAEVLRVFKAMGDNDGIVVKKEGGNIHLTDGDNEYMINLGESEMDDMNIDAESYFGDEVDEDMDFEMDDEVVYEIEMGDDDYDLTEDEDDLDMEDEPNSFEVDDEEIVYEIEMDDEEMSMSDDFEMMEDMDMGYEDEEEESMSGDDFEMMEDMDMDYEEDDIETVMEAVRKAIKPKGVGIGRGPKFSYDKKPNMGGGFSEKKKEAFGKGVKAMGTGKAKFEYKEGKQEMEKAHKMNMTKKMETKEASRTYGNGSKNGSRGLRKAKTNNRNYEYNPFKLSESRSNPEVRLLKEKNEEYKKALDVFRTKLNEVAVFNSNLAYATRLFTEHSTTKQEKINILKRFDNVESLKESKNLYRAIKSELNSGSSSSEQKINESIERTVNRSVETGSAVNLIESKTYENPQFLRMKDLMGKIK